MYKSGSKFRSYKIKIEQLIQFTKKTHFNLISMIYKLCFLNSVSFINSDRVTDLFEHFKNRSELCEKFFNVKF